VVFVPALWRQHCDLRSYPGIVAEIAALIMAVTWVNAVVADSRAIRMAPVCRIRRARWCTSCHATQRLCLPPDERRCADLQRHRQLGGLNLAHPIHVERLHNQRVEQRAAVRGPQPPANSSSANSNFVGSVTRTLFP